MHHLNQIKKELRGYASAERKASNLRFFKTAPGQYGFGDTFIGVSVPNIGKVAKQFYRLVSMSELKQLLQSKVHEERYLALRMLVEQFHKAAAPEQKKLVRFYLMQKDFVNNWDLVDTSAEQLYGRWLYEQQLSVEPLFKLAKSQNLWHRRIAVLSSFHFIKHGNSQPALALIELLLHDSEDLLHKACGWMLREIGKRGMKAELALFLKKYAAVMPRTMLRYALEHFPAKERAYYMKQKKHATLHK